MEILKEQDASLDHLNGKTVAVLGYGNQGRTAPGGDPWAGERYTRQVREAAWRMVCEDNQGEMQ